jgi:hypothetical protein
MWTSAMSVLGADTHKSSHTIAAINMPSTDRTRERRPRIAIRRPSRPLSLDRGG